MWAKAQRPGNTCSKVITCFLFTFFYLHSDLMAIKSEAKANAACIKTKKRNEITTHAVNFNAHTHSNKYTRTLLAPRAYTQYRRFRTHMFFIPHPCVGLP